MSAAAIFRAIAAPIASFLADPAVEEVCVDRPGQAFVRRHGQFEQHAVSLCYDDLVDAAYAAGALRRQDVGEAMPLLSTELPGGERAQFVLPPCVPAGTVSMTIRRPGDSVAPLSAIRSRYTTDRWNEWDGRKEAAQAQDANILAAYDSGDIEAFLDACVKARLNILLAGKTGSGKTTLSKTLMAQIAPTDRIITIEDTPELVVSQPNHVRLLYSKGGQGAAPIGPVELLEASLRMRPDRVLLQELREGRAAYVYAQEINAGHPGSITTIHGATPEQAFERLFSLCKGSEEGAAMSDDAVLRMLTASIDLIVPFNNEGRVFSIREVWLAADARRRGETARDLLH